MNLFDEPQDHAIGRSRGGLTTKIHALFDGNMRPLVMLLGPGQGGDSPMFENLMNSLKVEREGSGRPRTHPDRTMADQTCSSNAIRTYCAGAALTASSPKRTTRKPTANAKAPPADAPSPTTRTPTTGQRRRAQLQHPQAMAIPGHPLRQTGPHLPLSDRPARHRHLEHSIRRHVLGRHTAAFALAARHSRIVTSYISSGQGTSWRGRVLATRKCTRRPHVRVR